MPDVIECDECGKEVVVTRPGRPPKYCPECRVIVTRRNRSMWRRRRLESKSSTEPDEPGPTVGEGVAQEPPPTALWQEILEGEGRAVCPRCDSINATITWKMGTYHVDLTARCPDCKLHQSRIESAPLTPPQRSTPPAAADLTRSSTSIEPSPASAGPRTSTVTPTHSTQNAVKE